MKGGKENHNQTSRLTRPSEDLKLAGDPRWLRVLRFTPQPGCALACFTKTRVCSSCFGSTNSGMRLFTKTQICSSCFGSTNLGPSASFKSSDGLVKLDVWLWFSFPPFILSFHGPCAPRRPRWSLSHYFGRDPPHSMHLANEFGLTALASVSSSRPPQFGICCCRCFV